MRWVNRERIIDGIYSSNFMIVSGLAFVTGAPLIGRVDLEKAYPLV